MNARTETKSAARHKLRRFTYPFAAIVGRHAAKRALLLLAVEPGLKGALIASERSSDAQTLFRSFTAILPNRHIDGPQSNESDLGRDMPVVEVPLNVSDDRLLGAIDLERTVSTGRREVLGGLLAEADGGVLLVGDINLLDSGTANHIAHAVDRRHVVLEREGVSAIHSANFTLLACFDPAGGEPRSLLIERVDLIVNETEQYTADERAEAVSRRLRFEKDPAGFTEGFMLETAELRSLIQDARARLPQIDFSREQVRAISQIAMKLGVQGNSADLAVLKTARANAALSGRTAINQDDIVVAIQFVLAPRASTLPAEEHEQPRQQPSQAGDSEENDYIEQRIDERDFAPGSIEDMNIQAIDAPIPNDLLKWKASLRRARTGKHLGATSHNRGRYVRSVMHRNRSARIAVDATLRAAAPSQSLRRSRAQVAESFQKTTSDRRVRVEPGDLRFKQLNHRSGMLFILAVDASGSMAVNRMAQAKGALTRLLGRAYLYRDKVALISFRGEQAEVLLAPTRSVELAKRIVDALPAGGGTPISAGVLKATELARMARLRGLSQAMLVLFTDGRANIGLTEGPTNRSAAVIEDELRQLGRLLHSEEIASVVVDTKSRFVSSGEGRALAQMLGSRYLYLPRFDPAAVQRTIFAVAEERRR
ncbi:MAG TPA: magnesium chelatase ATPase subunit D [Blastocatellia bacterium]|nr:magnesium chelatase ATPase subunit D [Blastocatellia bacterium]